MAIPPHAFVHIAAHTAHVRREQERKRQEQERKAANQRHFFDAAIEGSADSLLRFLSINHVNVNASDTKYVGHPTALYHAAQKGHSQIVELLLNHGAKIDWGLDDRKTPLWIAARNGHQTVLEILIKRGGSVNGCNAEGLTPLA